MPATIRKSSQSSASPELFPADAFVRDEVEMMKSGSETERGAIFTRREVVEFMLDLMGYTADRPLWQSRLLEPSFGGGEFLAVAIDRLLECAARDGVTMDDLRAAICGVELHRDSFEGTLRDVIAQLQRSGFSPDEAAELATHWLINGDFLLEPLESKFDYVVGNPPYVRQELIPAPLLSEYRRRYTTLYDRADLYVLFMERSLMLLGERGQVAFICSDRWMKNRYGGPLRRMISDGYSMTYYVDMVGTDAFQSEVVAYPAITVIERSSLPKPVRIAHRPEVTRKSLTRLCGVLKGSPSGFNGTVTELSAAPKDDDPWLLEADAQPSLDLVRRLESEFPLIEESGCRVGIGVATGADKIFIGPFEELDVEDERKLPLATTRDILSGEVHWQGFGVVNPFEEDGQLADFERYPRFAAFMERHREVLAKRHCAKRGNNTWYRTIDRITPALTFEPKLLIPDIKGEANIVMDEGSLYPHHNLYFIKTSEWPLIALHRVLKAGVARLFVRAYSTKMRGGCLRFQAQYLRRIRLPKWSEVPSATREILTQPNVVSMEDTRSAVMGAYRLREEEFAHLSD